MPIKASSCHPMILGSYYTWARAQMLTKLLQHHEARLFARNLIKHLPEPSIVKYCFQHRLIKKLIKMLFNVHSALLPSSFTFQTLLIRVITFPNCYKNALACKRLVRKYMDSSLLLTPPTDSKGLTL